MIGRVQHKNTTGLGWDHRLLKVTQRRISDTNTLLHILRGNLLKLTREETSPFHKWFYCDYIPVTSFFGYHKMLCNLREQSFNIPEGDHENLVWDMQKSFKPTPLPQAHKNVTPPHCDLCIFMTYMYSWKMMCAFYRFSFYCICNLISKFTLTNNK